MTTDHDQQTQDASQDHPNRAATKRDFWIFWSGQTVSNLGSSVTLFAIPLLVLKLTNSPISLGLAIAVEFLPYLLFGLTIGAWVDRANRKQLMILVDLCRAAMLLTIPLLFAFGWLSVWWLYLIGFLNSLCTICFSAAEFAALPSLVDKKDLVSANGRIQASFASMQVLGPLLAGLLIAIIPISWLMTIDAVSFLISACSLTLIRKSFNKVEGRQSGKTIRNDIVEGLRFVMGHPVLRNISLMMALVNLVINVSFAQMMFFLQEHLHASDSQIGLFYAAGGLGVVLLSLAAGPLRKHWSFSKVALGALMIDGILFAALALSPFYWLNILLWSCCVGLGALFNINTSSLRQEIVPNDMLGRVMSIAMVLAWSAIPIGATLGGFLIDWSQNVVLVFVSTGILTTVIACAFSFTSLGNAERYIEKTGHSTEKAPD